MLVLGGMNSNLVFFLAPTAISAVGELIGDPTDGALATAIVSNPLLLDETRKLPLADRQTAQLRLRRCTCIRPWSPLMLQSVFSEFALLLMISAAAGAVSLWLRQPVLIAYIVVGIVAGPAVLGVVTAHDQIDLLAQIGVAVLLFVVGLKLDLQHIRHIGPVALATGLGQLAFTIMFGFFLILLMGKGWMEALYVAVALTFSSTIIIVKLLSDKREIDSLHGRIAVGFLIVQDSGRGAGHDGHERPAWQRGRRRKRGCLFAGLARRAGGRAAAVRPDALRAAEGGGT